MDRLSQLIQAARWRVCVLAVLAFLYLAVADLSAQEASARTKLLGSVTAVSGNVLTLKTDSGSEASLTVSDIARVLQMPPGSKSLSAATPISVQDIQVGDRVLAMANASADGKTYSASTVVAMKKTDIAQKQQQERQEWQTRGISGVVKAVDPAADTVTVSTGTFGNRKDLPVQVAKTTIVRRYAPDSTRFDDAKTSSLDEIKPGDQLRAKGDKSADGTKFDAEEVVAGTFRNIAGTVISTDAANETVTVNDLATKKPFIVRINNDSQLHRLPPMMAQMIAMRLKGGGTPGSTAAPGAMRPTSSEASGNGAPGGGNLQQAINRAPALQISELKAGDAVMVLTTEGQAPGSATAVTLLAGVEPLLQASPRASESVLSASWNLGGAPGQDAQQ